MDKGQYSAVASGSPEPVNGPSSLPGPVAGDRNPLE